MDIRPYLQQLVINQRGEHYQKLKGAIWLLLYLLVSCGNNTWIMVRKIDELAYQMGLDCRTIQRWLNLLQKQHYVLVKKAGREQFIHLRALFTYSINQYDQERTTPKASPPLAEKTNQNLSH